MLILDEIVRPSRGYVGLHVCFGHPRGKRYLLSI